MLNKALSWIEQRAATGKPFFLYFPMCPPHTPIAPSAEFSGKSGANDVVRNDPKYGDWLYQGDAMLGRIMETLERNKLAENTLLIATSDNGAEGRAYAPLRESKRSIYEGGHRVPFAARWPGRVQAGATYHHTICLNDLMATVAELLSVSLPPDAAEDSVSLLPALLGTSHGPIREATVHQSMAGDLAIRQGAWKLVFLKDGRRELFNVEEDISERIVRIDNPEVVAKLTALMERYLADGRSTPGTVQKNDVTLSLNHKAAPKKPKAKGKKQ